MEKRPNQALVWWIIWAAITTGLIAIYVLMHSRPGPNATAATPAGWLAFIPLGTSAVLRWLVFPKQRDATKALVIFILGMATAEAGGILGTLLGGVHRDELFALGVVGVLQWMPFFARRFYSGEIAPGHGFRSR